MIFMVPDCLLLTHRHEKRTRWSHSRNGGSKTEAADKERLSQYQRSEPVVCCRDPSVITNRGCQRNLSGTADWSNPRFAASPFFNVSGSRCHGNQVCLHLFCMNNSSHLISSPPPPKRWLGVKQHLHWHSWLSRICSLKPALEKGQQGQQTGTCTNGDT